MNVVLDSRSCLHDTQSHRPPPLRIKKTPSFLFKGTMSLFPSRQLPCLSFYCYWLTRISQVKTDCLIYTIIMSHLRFCLFLYSRGMPKDQNIKDQKEKHQTITWNGGRELNTVRVSGDLECSVTWQHTNTYHLATLRCQKDMWHYCLSTPENITGEFIFIYVYSFI